MAKTNLLELIKKENSEVDHYLGEVTTAQFIADVKELVNGNLDKKIIEDAISNLQKLIDDSSK